MVAPRCLTHSHIPQPPMTLQTFLLKTNMLLGNLAFQRSCLHFAVTDNQSTPLLKGERLVRVCARLRPSKLALSGTCEFLEPREERLEM